MAGTRQRQHLRDVSQALYWVPRHDDGSAVTAAFLPALGYEISERYVFFCKGGGVRPARTPRSKEKEVSCRPKNGREDL